MTKKTREAKQAGEPDLVPAVARNGNGEVVAEQPAIDNIYSPDFLSREDALFLLAAERTARPTSKGNVLSRRPPQ